LPARDIVVVGASAGGIEALIQLVQGLPPGLPAAVFVTCHIPPEGTSNLPEILSRRGQLLAVHPRDGEEVRPGQIYVAPPDRHMTLERGVVHVGRGPREHRFRPAIDPLFRSAARAYGPRVIGVLLSGALSDGVAGMLAVRAGGGLRVIQDPDEALLPFLPQRARDLAGADHIVPARGMAALLAGLVTSQVPPVGEAAMPEKDPLEETAEAAARDMQQQARGERNGAVSIYRCPECGGSLWQVNEEKLLRFRCHVGHVYQGEDLFAEQSASLEAALWVSVRTFKEKGVLARQLAARDREKGDGISAARFEEEARQASHYAELIEHYLLQDKDFPRAGGSPAGALEGGPP
jgi:two-component system chemotaxis response regulator CheB